VEIDFKMLEERLGYHFADQALLHQALTHPSYDHEQPGSGRDGDYQRLEFLGDAVLGLLLAEALFHRLPGRSEGDLSRLRSQLADQETLATIARSRGLGRFIHLGRGEQLSGGMEKDSILADVLESLIAAVYLEGGLQASRSLVDDFFNELLEQVCQGESVNDSKSELQELLSARRLPPPEYRLVSESGPPHDRRFLFQVLVCGEPAGEGEGRSKKAAQQSAAAAALVAMKTDR